MALMEPGELYDVSATISTAVRRILHRLFVEVRPEVRVAVPQVGVLCEQAVISSSMED
jgi:hypothetical protein